MKKIISCLLVVCMITAIIPLATFTAAATYGYALGDANDDNEINTKDVLLIRRYASNVIGEKELNIKASDADQNDEVNTKDVLKLRRVAAGVEALEGVNEDGKYKVGTISIGGKNLSRFTIVVPDDATECMKKASRVLRNMLAEACGYTVSITDYEDEVSGYKIKFMFDDGTDELGLEGYRVYVDTEGDLNVICGTLRGPIYAAYYILEEYIGYRYFPGVSTFVYSSDSVDISSTLDVKEVPVYSYRAGGGGDHPIELRMNDSTSAQNAEAGWRVGSLFIHAHSYAYQMAGYEHIYQEEYADHTTQPCLTVEETYLKIVDYNLKLLNERETRGQHLGEMYTQISCSPNDNTDFCYCSGCKKVYQIEGSIAGTVFRLSNRVVEAMQEVYPDIEVYTIAYWDARNPPKYTRPHDDVCVCFCIQGCNNHSYDDEASCAANNGNPRLQSPSGNNCSNVEDMGYCRGWAELTNNLQIWYYSANFCYYMAPSPNVMNVYNDFKYLAEIGATGMYCEGSGYGNAFEKLRAYLAGKMMWNPYMSEEEYNEHINEYLEAYYGAGWKNIREYLDMQTEAGDLNGCWTNNFDRPWNMYNEKYFCENYLHMAELFDKASAEAQNETYRTRIQQLRMHVDFLGLDATYESDYLNGTDEQKALYKAHFKALYDYVKATNVTLAKIDLVNFPTSADDIIKPMSWFGEDFTGYWEWDGSRWI